MYAIRDEAAADACAIADLNRVAFGGDEEAALFDRLQADGLVSVSLVAVENGVVVGHILFSRLSAHVDGRAIRAVALAPMAVVPARQGQGIGNALIRAGLVALRARAVEAVFVLGHETYYPRFGFSPGLAQKFRAPFAGNAFMALALTPGALDGAGGAVCYPPAFGIVAR